jgi:hypothetical protein
MRLLKSLVAIGTTGICEVDTIEHEGKLWLVPEWIDGHPSKGFSTPARAIRIDSLPRSGTLDRPVLYDPIPQDVFDGKVTGQFEVVELPNLFVQIGTPGNLH